MTSTTVRWLLDRPALDLTLVAGSGRLDGEIDCVITSELASPGQWLSGGEFMLTTGLRLPDGRAECRQYIRGLVESGVAGVGFGVGLSHPEIPEALVDAAEELSMPLVRVPLRVPFAAIARIVLDRIAEVRYEQFVRASRTQPSMTRAILSRGVEGVVAELAVAIGQTVILLDARRELVAARPGVPAPDLMSQVREFVDHERRSAGGVRISADRAFTMQRISVGKEVFGHLVVTGAEPLSDLARVLVGHAASLLTLEHAKPTQVVFDQRALLGEVLAGVLDGLAATGHVASMLARACGRSQTVRVAVFAFTDERVARNSVAELGSACTDLWRPAFVTQRGSQVAVLLRGDDGPALAGSLSQRLSRTAGVGVGLAVPIAETAASYADAALVARTAAPGEVLDVSTSRSLLANEQIRAGLSAAYPSMLGALLDDPNATELVETLRDYLEAGGQWDRAASAAGVHRHTLRRRVDRIERLLSVDLRDARTRAELLLVLLGHDAQAR
ncbi:PucR family transcriptional regulator [Gordonia jinhuaensis]|uniref:PucR family transcriptional regulator n=1 Tax=Gordonia jinhuaensis TaxID=1517702 RepID=UPI00166A0847|nr:PucR family transcriptional regulator [Gordonia jinhuaensis]